MNGSRRQNASCNEVWKEKEGFLMKNDDAKIEVMIGRPYLEIMVDDLMAWQNIVINQMSSPHNKVVADLHEYCGRTWIFRGQQDASWQISSSFERLLAPMYRDGILNSEKMLRGKELSAIAEFKARVWKDVSVQNQNNFTWLMLMRHQGVPTRLVDFTESAAIALYFATESMADTDFAVWGVNRDAIHDIHSQSYVGKEFPCIRNLVAKFGKDFQSEVINLSNTDPDLKAFREMESNFLLSDVTVFQRKIANKRAAEKILELPLNQEAELPEAVRCLYVYPEFPSQRMLAQKGLFLMPIELRYPFMAQLLRGIGVNEDVKPIRMKLSEVLEKKVKINELRLIKFIFHREMQAEVKKLLCFANCSKATIYPDVYGVAQAVKDKLSESLKKSKYLLSTSFANRLDGDNYVFPPSELSEKEFQM